MVIIILFLNDNSIRYLMPRFYNVDFYLVLFFEQVYLDLLHYINALLYIAKLQILVHVYT